MHCPDNVDGGTYIEMVAATSLLLSKNLDAKQTFILAEFLQSVGFQLLTLATFKEFETVKRPPPKPAEKKEEKKEEKKDGKNDQKQ